MRPCRKNWGVFFLYWFQILLFSYTNRLWKSVLQLCKHCFIAEKFKKKKDLNIGEITITVAPFAFLSYQDKSLDFAKIKEVFPEETSTEKNPSVISSIGEVQTVVMKKQKLILGIYQYCYRSWHSWTIRILTQKSIYFFNSPPQLRKCYLSHWWQKWSSLFWRKMMSKTQMQVLITFLANSAGQALEANKKHKGLKTQC